MLFFQFKIKLKIIIFEESVLFTLKYLMKNSLLQSKTVKIFPDTLFSFVRIIYIFIKLYNILHFEARYLF